MTDEQENPHADIAVAQWAAERDGEGDGERAELSGPAATGYRLTRSRSRLSNVTPEDLAGFRKRYAAMETVAEIAADTGFSAGIVSRALKNDGVTLRRGRPPVIRPAQAESIRVLHNRNLTVAEIAEETGYKQVAVGSVLKRTRPLKKRGRRPGSRPGSSPTLFPSPVADQEELAAAGLRLRQIEAVKNVVAEIALEGKCRVTMPPGSGKTRVGAETSRQLAEHGRVLVVEPSLTLLAQVAAEYVQYLGDQAGVLGAVCSDDHATGDAIADADTEPDGNADGGADADSDTGSDTDDLAALAEQDRVALADLNVGSSTDPDDIAAWTRAEGRLTVFCSYSSLPKVAAAHRAGAPPWDLIVVDEAHRAAGLKNGVWSTVNRDEEIPSRRRLYMTATPRLLDAGRGGDAVEVASMDNEAIFGREVYKLPFGQAIDEKILADYRLVVCTMTRSELEQRGATGTRTGLVTTPGGPVPWKMLIAQVALLKTAAEHGVRSAITFHHRVAAAQLFAETLRFAAMLLPPGDQPSALLAQAVHGNMPRDERRCALDSLQEVGERLTVVSNARVLTDGVDVPELDAVVFVDLRQSTVDIVQATGRALRRGQRQNKVAKIIIPVLLPEPDSTNTTNGAGAPGASQPDVALDGPWSAQLVRVVCALADQDERLRQWLDTQRARPRRGSEPQQLPPWMDHIGEIDPGFADALAVRVLERTTSTWLVGYGAAKAFRAEHGHLRVHGDYITDDGLQLGQWILRQRQARKTGEVSADRVALLDTLGMIWDAREADWQAGYAAARVYHAEHGHLNLRSEYVTADGYKLGSWVTHQRMFKNKGELAQRRVKALEKLGFDWDPAQTTWQRYMAMAIAYFQTHDDLRVPYGYVDPASGLNLGNWVGGLRERKLKGRLDDDQIAALDAIGMIWNVPEHDNARRIAAIEAYHARHGHLDAALSYVSANGYKLGEWLKAQRGYRRRGELSPDQIVFLDRYGMVWDRFADAWNQGIAATRRYHAEHGHLNVGKDYIDADGYPLDAWVKTQRARRTGDHATAQEIATLDELGMIWNLKEFQRQQRLAACYAFYAEHRHLDIPRDYVTSGGITLGSWLELQRTRFTKDELSDAEIADLNKFGMVWRKRAQPTSWSQRLAAAHQYRAEHGDLNVPATHVTPDGLNLGNWINHLRQRERQGTLPPDQKAELDALGMKWVRPRRKEAEPGILAIRQELVQGTTPPAPVPLVTFSSGAPDDPRTQTSHVPSIPSGTPTTEART